MAIAIVSLSLVACNKQDALNSYLDLENLETVEAENRSANETPASFTATSTLKRKCFELNYPVGIVTPGGSITSVADRQALKTFFRTYRAEGGEKEDLSFAYPIGVTLEDGTFQSVSNQEEMEALKESCPPRERADRGNRGEPCFRVVYPLTATSTDGSTLTIEAKRDWIRFKRSVKNALENDEVAPMLNFPIEVTIEEEIKMIASQAELDELKASCREN